MSRLYTALAENAKRFPAHEAIIEGETRWTYADLLHHIDAIAAGFKALNIAPGERVGLMLFNQKEFLAAYFALRKIGAVVVPINIQMLPQDIGYVIQNSGVRHILTVDALYPHLKPLPLNVIVIGQADGAPCTFDAFLDAGKAVGDVAPVDTAETDLAFLLYTSGTTGHPKGVMLTEKNVWANLDGFEQVVEFGFEDRMILALPLFHAYGLIVALAGLMFGASLTLIPKFQPKSILEAMIHEKATILPLVPTLYTVILELIARHGAPMDLPHLRFCISGGAALPAQLLHKIESTLHTVLLEGYGLTETSPVIAVNDPKVGSIPGSVGKPLPNVQVRIVAEDGRDLPGGEVGEIWVKGDNVMMGYYNLPEATREVLTEDGWLKTGDLGHLDAEGRLYISGGRKKDLIIKAGENISPVPIEEVLYRHPAVREAAVVGVHDERLGEEIAACVSLKEGQSTTPQEILRFCREQLTAQYVPGKVEIFDELPKNPTGKIAKKILREQLAQRIAASR